jgi:hypothetical protein
LPDEYAPVTINGQSMLHAAHSMQNEPDLLKPKDDRQPSEMERAALLVDGLKATVGEPNGKSTEKAASAVSS